MKKTSFFIISMILCLTCFDVSFASERKEFEKIQESYLKEDYVGTKKKIAAYLKEYRGGRNRRKVKQYQDAINKKLCILAEAKQNIEILNKTVYVKKYVSQPEYYIVQIGAFKSHKNASKTARSVKRKGFDVILLKVTQENSVLYKVRAGKFRNKINAQKLIRKLRVRGFKADIIEE
jgi:cell division protein FtsN